ncbi:amidophosphoribosyltransferase [Candidatus Micrarchaeota archaeon]|nr:amidophosphoribosyltransferase [Candidatus Micrarchaeota archaeon]
MVRGSLNTCFQEKQEECGVVAVYSKKGRNVAPLLYKALFALQHRGQDAAGFAVFDRGKLDVRKGMGLVSEIFRPEDVSIPGSLGIGHTRYPTIGECRMCDVQPSVFDNIAVAHNGHVANYKDLKKELEADYRFLSTVDSEPLVYLMDSEDTIEEGVKKTMETVEGAFSDVSICKGKLVVFRDRFALRPLVWGEDEDFICFASETVALDINNIPYRGDVRGGELVSIENGKLQRKQLVPEKTRHCMFEYVYFSRPDSTINGLSVHEARSRLGKALAEEAPAEADVIVPVPDTSRTAASAYSRALGIPYDEGLMKNRYIGRTFIMPSQEKRKEAVRVKLNPVREIVAGKRVVLVDDSIVRGTTLKEIVALTRGAGAGEVHLRITCPPVRAPCFYGVDMSTYSELIAHKKSVDEIREYLGADSLHYISLEGLKKALGGLPLCTGCLTEEYHTEYVKKLAEKEKM